MFFQGTLQEGIATALQQNKLVVCFVTDGESESQKWENEFLVDDAIRQFLSTKAVMLKLQAGSTEAGYLAAIFPLPKTPTLVIMNKGELKEYIAAGVSREDFMARASKALGGGTVSQPQEPTSSQPTSASSPTSPPEVAQPSPQIQALLADRAARLEAQRKKEAEQRRAEKGKAKAESSQKPKDPAQEKYSEELKKRQQAAREDRQRVLQAIADDKAARKAKAQEREFERGMLKGGPVSLIGEDGGRVVGVASTGEKEAGGKKEGDGRCKLQIRLWDGSTVRHTWDGSETLGKGVRGWLDQQEGMQGVGVGYGFKVILTPKPSRSIDVGEEGQTLAELGLTPSATLVLVPVAGKGSSAYPTPVGGNVLTRFVWMILGVFTGLWALVVGFVSTLFSTAGAPAAVSGPTDMGVATGRDQGRKAAGLRQLRPQGERKDGQQFYNGNSTNFEPRKDDDDEQQ
ncbi:hypothetical protein GE09DRAFT_763577 [Coniochaeta sp. 2T2.1]|nr:hypothetical protein GE09DRAFT_763577 [Coniochaeta sp. 2T2.1]